MKRNKNGKGYLLRVRRAAALRRARVLTLRNQGYTLQAIADQWGISRQKIHQLEKRARKLAAER